MLHLVTCNYKQFTFIGQGHGPIPDPGRTTGSVATLAVEAIVAASRFLLSKHNNEYTGFHI